jgi:hypothetical protein
MIYAENKVSNSIALRFNNSVYYVCSMFSIIAIRAFTTMRIRTLDTK